MMRFVLPCLISTVVGCSVEHGSPVTDAAAPSPPELYARVLVAWGGQNVTTTDPEDSRVPRTLSGPMTACPSVVGDPVVHVDIEVIIGTEAAYVVDETFDCALGHTTIPVPAGSGTFRLDVFTASGYSWLASYTPITTVGGQTTDETSNLNTEIPTSGGGDGGDGGGLGGYL